MGEIRLGRKRRRRRRSDWPGALFPTAAADDPQWKKRKASKAVEALRKAARMSKQSKRQLFDINDGIVVAPKKGEKLSSMILISYVYYTYIHSIP